MQTMDRRQALRNIAAFVAGGMVDPERLLWVPNQQIVVPALGPLGLRFHPDAIKFVMGPCPDLFNPPIPVRADIIFGWVKLESWNDVKLS